MRGLARWSEMVFAIISLLLWSTMPFPPTARVMWNWVVLSISVALGITFFIWLKNGARAAWLSAGLWAGLVVANLLIGIIRAGFPSEVWASAAMGISFLLVYAWGLVQVVVLFAVIRLSFQQGGVRALGA